MGEKNWLEIMNNQMWLKQVQETNQYTMQFGLSLSNEDDEILLAIFAQAIRRGYKTQGRGEFEKFDIVQRWDKELYLETLKELCWR